LIQGGRYLEVCEFIVRMDGDYFKKLGASSIIDHSPLSSLPSLQSHSETDVNVPADADKQEHQEHFDMDCVHGKMCSHDA
jgi:hypothetical protein